MLRTFARIGRTKGGFVATRYVSADIVVRRRALHQTLTVREMPPGFDMNHPVIHKMRGNERVLKAMAETMQLLQQKGVISGANPKPPSFMKIMQMMSDAEIKQQVTKLQQIMAEEGISFSPTDMMALMKGQGVMSGDASKSSVDSVATRTPDEPTSEKKGLFNRITSTFKSGS
ncbi:hypothetical protein COEREDRAFT_7129 [Coemansia reversa NRRL 1564]|uniref:Uncharacterized protein n=1 Tax=Coemansia reversa (strain ATCC 12441 / NRRL 1564) TaxID=763665 RepID=A0A2G5BG20_COERN|nr:hypothetical protein COEREDRAFT_7129 [Coemansia reversa NRRL 1564]|eukprot:PIA17950.1 hypothetical protein COEREDRAFT_7129 [Coemansia reversa NRRL 1564]